MPFFQNPFDQDFRDRQYTVNFKIGPNKNSSVLMVNWTAEPYDLSSDSTLTVFYAIDQTLSQFAKRDVTVSGATAGATTALEVAAALNADAVVAGLWVATAQPQFRRADGDAPNIVALRARRQNTAIRAYIQNTGAEKHLHFNAMAPIAELPTYYRRHTIAQRATFTDGAGLLVELDTGVAYDRTLITDAGLVYGNLRDDWELLVGRSGLFPFKKLTYDGSSRLTSVLEYPAGAGVGDLGSLTRHQYVSSATVPAITTVEPYTLTSGDLVSPP